MFRAVNILLILLFFRKISGQLPSSGYAEFGRNPPTSNLRRQEDSVTKQHLDLQGGGNVQKLVPTNNQNFDRDIKTFDHYQNLGPDGPPYSAKSKNKTNMGGRVAPQNVNRVQELTERLWPMGIVPFYVDKEVYDPTTVNRIIKAMAAIESVSCVIFRELENKPDNSPDGWLHFTNPKQARECVHVFSTVDGGIELILGFDCLHPAEILHALLHGLGFRDEVTHPHRDLYIRVLWDNIQPKYRGLFRIQHEDASYKLVEYDPMSIMHFHDRAFSDNGAATIAAIIPGLQITSSTTLSQLDIMRLNLAFSRECNKRNIGDLLLTCKNSLTSLKEKPRPSLNTPDDDKTEANKSITENGDQTVDEEIEPGEGQNENKEELNLDKVGLSKEETEEEKENAITAEEVRSDPR